MFLLSVSEARFNRLFHNFGQMKLLWFPKVWQWDTNQRFTVNSERSYVLYLQISVTLRHCTLHADFKFQSELTGSITIVFHAKLKQTENSDKGKHTSC